MSVPSRILCLNSGSSSLKLALYDGSYGYRFETAATATEPASKIACNVP